MTRLPPMRRSTRTINAAASVMLCLLVSTGCRPDVVEEEVESEVIPVQLPALRVWVIDDAELSESIQRQWTARGGGELKLKSVTAEEFLAAAQDKLRADTVIYPSGLLGTLASAEIIEAAPESSADDPILERMDLLPMTRLREVMWGTQMYAVSFGSPSPVLLYRQDLLANLELKPPTTWAEYQEVAAALATGDAGVQSVCEPLAPGWAGQILLARAATYATHRSQYSTLFEYSTMKPLIDRASFVRALEELAAVASLQDNSRTVTPVDARREFLAGQCAMAITWPSRVDDQSPEDEVAFADHIGVLELPGGKTMHNFSTDEWEPRDEDDTGQVSLLAVDGRLGSVCASSRQKQAAWSFLFFLTGTEAGIDVGGTSRHTTLVRMSQLADADMWVDSALAGDPASEYAEALEAAHGRGVALPSIRIPGRDQYLAALDEAVYAVLDGNASASEALTTAAARWDEITNSLGRDSQQAAYTRSIGLEP